MSWIIISLVWWLMGRPSGLGIDSFDVNLEKQEVLVTGPIGYDELLEKIKKTGKEVGPASDERELVLSHRLHPGPFWRRNHGKCRWTSSCPGRGVMNSFERPLY